MAPLLPLPSAAAAAVAAAGAVGDIGDEVKASAASQLAAAIRPACAYCCVLPGAARAVVLSVCVCNGLLERC
jgi:hypothetical protein